MPNTSHAVLPIVVQEKGALIEARILHRRLNVETRFNDWFNRRVKEYGFEPNKDFYSNLSSKKRRGGHNSSNYMLTLDMAKELAMVERNETGRAIRRYFIEKERELRGLLSLPPAAGLFRGLRVRTINDRRMYPYRAILERCGYSTRPGCSQRKARYWQHFVKEGKLLYITEELALHLHQQRQVMQNRIKLREMQPVLPLNFGQPIPNPKILSHA